MQVEKIKTQKYTYCWNLAARWTKLR